MIPLSLPQDCSRNGTYLNEKLIGTGRRMILKNNDVIGLAHATYKALQFKEVSRNQDELKNLPSAIRDKYYVGKKLGSGACGVVHLIFDTVSCQPYAMKHVVKNLLVESTRPRILNEPNRVMNEVNIMKALDHVRTGWLCEPVEVVLTCLFFLSSSPALSKCTTL